MVGVLNLDGGTRIGGKFEILETNYDPFVSTCKSKSNFFADLCHIIISLICLGRLDPALQVLQALMAAQEQVDEIKGTEEANHR